jgi:hypothetical protein
MVGRMSVRIGAPREICRARAPKMRALSNRVYFSTSSVGDGARVETIDSRGAAEGAATVKGSGTQGTLFTLCSPPGSARKDWFVRILGDLSGIPVERIHL